MNKQPLTKPYLDKKGIRTLLLIDSSNLIMGGLYASHSAGYKVYGHENSYIRTGGVYNLLSFLNRKAYPLNSTLIVFIFDRSSSKKKALREKFNVSSKTDYEFLATSSLMEQFLNELGMNTLSVEGYEADEIAYSLVQRYYHYFDKIDIACNDRDWTACLDTAGKVTQISVNGSPAIGYANYKEAFGSNIKIPYGSLWLYKTILGKPEEGRHNDTNWGLFYNILDTVRDKFQIPLNLLHDFEASKMVLQEYFKDDETLSQYYLGVLELNKLRPVEVELYEPSWNSKVFEVIVNLFRLSRLGIKYGVTLKERADSEEREFISYVHHNILNNNFNFNIGKLSSIQDIRVENETAKQLVLSNRDNLDITGNIGSLL